MTTEIEKPMELVEPDQDSGSPASNGSSADSLSVQLVQEKKPNMLPEQSPPSPEESESPDDNPVPDLLPEHTSEETVSDPLPEHDPEETVPDLLPSPTSEETVPDHLPAPTSEETGQDLLPAPTPEETVPDPLPAPTPEETVPDPHPVHPDQPIPGKWHPGPEPDGVRYRKGCDGEYEACYRLRRDGWIVSRWQGYPSPPDLIAVRSDEILLVMVRRSKQTVPGAHAVYLRYRDGLACLRDIGSPAVVRKEVWIFAPPDGCQCYEVLPGGIRRIRREWGRKESAESPSVEVPFPGTVQETARSEGA